MNIGLEKCNYYSEIFKANMLFKEISQESINKLLKISTAELLPKNSSHINEDRVLYKFHIIISGKLKIYNVNSEKNRQFILFILKENDVFDTISLLDGVNHHMYYETLEPTEVISIPIFKMRKWMEENPEFNTALQKYFTKQMRLLESFTIDLALENIATRLAKLLMRHLNTSTNEIEFINDLSHDELAGLIGTTRAVLNRHLQDFKEMGILKISRKNIKIIDVDQLKLHTKT